jgi:hypothetical protein
MLAGAAAIIAADGVTARQTSPSLRLIPHHTRPAQEQPPRYPYPTQMTRQPENAQNWLIGTRRLALAAQHSPAPIRRLYGCRGLLLGAGEGVEGLVDQVG